MTSKEAARKQPPTRPRLGSFSRPTNPDADGAQEEQETQDADNATAAGAESDAPKHNLPETDAEREAQRRLSLYEEMQNALTPVTDYKQYLADNDIDEKKAAEIVDNLLMRGFHEEKYPLSQRVHVTFRTREQRDTVRLQTAMQIHRPLFQASMDELTARYNMAASLAAYGREQFAFPKAEDGDEAADKLFEQRLNYIERLPDAVFSKLSIKLAKFDRLVACVMREGVAENF